MEGLFDTPSPFLDWLPGETLFSVCSRHHSLWGHSAASTTAELLFGRDRAGTHHDLPNSLDVFAERTGGRFGTADQIARDRTLLRYYRPLEPADEVAQAITAMRGPTVAHLKFRLGLLTSRFRANHPLKACLACIKADVAQHGWAYWHLQHQYPGVWVCPWHGDLLQTSRLKSTGVGRFLWHLPVREHLVDDAVSSSIHGQEPLQRLAQITVALVERKSADGWLAWTAIQPTIISRAAERGWLTAAGNLRLAEAAADYLRHCSAFTRNGEFAALPVNFDGAKLQVGRLLRTPRGNTHPLRLLLLLDWLFEGAADFIGCRDSVLNPTLAPPVNEDRRVDLAASAGTRMEQVVAAVRSGASPSAAARLVGVDVTTAMAWTVAAGISIKRRPKVLTGAVRASLSATLRTGADKCDAASAHGVSVETVTRFMRTEVGLHDAWTAARRASAQSRARDAWTSAIAAHPYLGTKFLRSLCPSEYAWLYRNDREWLARYSPRASVEPIEARASRVQWDERDRQLSNEVQKAILNLTDGASGKLHLWQVYQAVPDLKAKLAALDRLPLTKRALELGLFRRASKPEGEGDLFAP
jgi:hypothetical protein